MQQEDTVQRPKNPVVVMPPVYELLVGFWRWCKLSEVCAIVPGVAKIAGNDFAPSPEVLIHHFAALVRPNVIPEHLRGTKDEPRKKKIFRYSKDGKGFWGTEVPISENGSSLPPYEPFMLDIGVPYPEELFVPEGWVIDTLKAIRLGAVAAADFGHRKMGFPPENKTGLIYLDGERGMMLVRVPQGL